MQSRCSASWRASSLAHLRRVALRRRPLRLAIPVAMRRHLPALEALRVAPRIPAARAHAAGPEGVPHGVAVVDGALPAVVRPGPPGAMRATDVAAAVHASRRVGRAVPLHEF